jgi:23S rRNA (cytidine1920-2'-O)/16S rRNA (cytidine1409-2'-O)-methyltransferase
LRADELLVARGFADSRDEAARLIMAGRVSIAGRRVEKPGERLREDAEIHVRETGKYVSRGGDKLASALDAFAIATAGRVALDAGCSTGGFTHCLLERGAARVYAVDVGYGQLAWSLRNDARVTLFERTNVRSLARAALDPPPTLVVADLSFVPLRSVLPVLAELAGADGELLLLVKPQFELPASEVPGGVVRDADSRRRAAASVIDALEALHFAVRGPVDSAVPGRDGNVELFVAASRARFMIPR